MHSSLPVEVKWIVVNVPQSVQWDSWSVWSGITARWFAGLNRRARRLFCGGLVGGDKEQKVCIAFRLVSILCPLVVMS